MVKISVLDDHDLLREGIKSVLQKRSDYEVIGEFKSGADLLLFLRRGGSVPDIVLMDVIMPGLSGIEVLQALKTEFPLVKVLMFSYISEEEFIINLIRAGHRGFCRRANSPTCCSRRSTRSLNSGGM